MGDEDKLQPLSGPGVSGNEPLVGREERQVPLEPPVGTTSLGDAPYDVKIDDCYMVPYEPIVELVKLHESGVEQVRELIREELRAALKETFQR